MVGKTGEDQTGAKMRDEARRGKRQFAAKQPLTKRAGRGGVISFTLSQITNPLRK
jgi:hypothetical protein